MVLDTFRHVNPERLSSNKGPYFTAVKCVKGKTRIIEVLHLFVSQLRVFELGAADTEKMSAFEALSRQGRGIFHITNFLLEDVVTDADGTPLKEAGGALPNICELSTSHAAVRICTRAWKTSQHALDAVNMSLLWTTSLLVHLEKNIFSS